MKGLLFTYLFTYGGALASLFNPFIGLLVYVSFAILKPEQLWFWSVPRGNYSRIVALALLVGWAARGFGSWQFGRARPVVLSLLGFWVWILLSAMHAPDQAVAWNWVESITKILLPVLVGLTTIDSVAKLKQLAWVMTLSVGYLAYTENEKYFLGGIRELDNGIAHGMTVGAGVAFFVGMRTQGWWRKLIAFACAALMVHAVLFHMSRGAMLGLGAVGFVSFLSLPKKPQHIAVFILAVIVGLRLAGPSVRDEFATIFDQDRQVQNDGGRRKLWADMWDAAQRNPVLGLGPGHWPRVAADYGWKRGKEGHGLWPQITAETGFPGGVLYAVFFGAPLVMLGRYVRRRDQSVDPELAWFGRMAAASLAGFIVEAQFGSFSGLEVAYYVVMLGAGTLKLSSLVPETIELPRHATHRAADWSGLPASLRLEPLGMSQAGSTAVAPGDVRERCETV